VVQAVGRVRPFTRPREVITFQMAQLPGVTYDTEFATLGEAREFFAVASRRQQKQADLAARVAELRCQGLSQAETAARLGVTERTVRNYEKGRTGKFPS
jgi:DNA-binding NarL/FixJ family response regulator